MRWLVPFLACSMVMVVGSSGARAQDAGADDEEPPTNEASSDDPATSDVPSTQSGSSGSQSGTRTGAPSSGSQSSTAAPMVINVHAGGREEEEEEAPQPQNPLDPHELEGESYHHLGVFVRGLFAPQAIQNLFVAGGTNGLNVGVGAFYNYRRDGLNLIAEVWWAGFFAQGAFRGLNETDFEMEWIESELSVAFGSLAAMWSIPIASFLAIEIGIGIGFGGVFGGLYRTEAYPAGTAGWVPCNGEGDPDAAYCDTSVRNGGEGSYQRVENSPSPYNFSGDVPPLWFWVDLPRVAIRIKPIRQLQIRVEGGFALYAIYFGGSVALGF